MRVTKAIREFIEEQVRIKAEQSTTIAEFKCKADEATARLREEREALKNKFDAEFQSAMEKYNFHERLGRKPCISLNYCYDGDLPEVVAYENAKRELREKQRCTTLDIIAEMELGGTKAELMAKLNNLQF